MADHESKQDTQMLDAIIDQMHNSNDLTASRALKAIRKMFSRYPPIDSLIQHGFVPLCVQLLDSQK